MRSKQVFFEALGTTEGAKYANDLASSKPSKWVKQLRKQDAMTAQEVDELGLKYEVLLRPPLTVEGEGDRLTAWLIDRHFRHPSGPYRPRQLEPSFLDYGGACATTYALMLSLLYNDTTGRMAGLLPPMNLTQVSAVFISPAGCRSIWCGRFVGAEASIRALMLTAD